MENGLRTVIESIPLLDFSNSSGNARGNTVINYLHLLPQGYIQAS